MAGKYKDIVDELEVLLDGFICDDVEETNQKLETIGWLVAEEAYA